MTCTNCGTQNENEARFCRVCGTALAAAGTGVPQQQGIPQPAAYAPSQQAAPAPQQQAAYTPPQGTHTPVEAVPQPGTYSPQQAPYPPPQEAPAQAAYAQPQNAPQPGAYAPQQTAYQQQPYAPQQQAYPQQGYPQQQGAYPSAPYGAATQTAYYGAPPKKKRKLWLLFALIALVLVIGVLCVLFLPSLLSGSKSGTALLYLKDGNIHYSSASKIEPFEVSSDLFDSSSTDPGDLGDYIQLSDDEQRIFFPDKGGVSGSINLYYNDVSAIKRGEDATKVDSDITSYQISANGKSVVYVKSGGTLYFHDLTERSKLDSDVDWFATNDDNSGILYVKAGALYYYGKDKTTQKVDSDVNKASADETLTNIFYLKNDTLYHRPVGEDKTKIDSDVADFFNISWEEGRLYYLKYNTESLPLYNFVDDDAASDTSKDWVRDALQSMTYDVPLNELYYYDGTATSMIAQGNYSSLVNHLDTQAIVYSLAAVPEEPVIRMSQLEYPEDVYELLYEAAETPDYYITITGAAYPLDAKAPCGRFAFDPKGTELYFIQYANEEDEFGELYHFPLGKEGPGAKTLYDDEVARFFLAENGNVFAAKDMKDRGCDLYLNKALLDTDVYLSSYSFNRTESTFAFFTDWNSNKSYGTLKFFNGKELEKVADDVHSFRRIDGNLMYLADYNTNRNRGDLYLYQGKGNSEKVDEDVTAILWFFKV